MSFIDKYKNKLSENQKKVFTNLFWAMLGKIVNMAGALLVGILVARYLGPSKYGLMNYVISYVTLFTIISNFGLDNIEIRELSKNPNKVEFVLGTCFRIRLFFSTIAFFLIILSLFFYKADCYTALMIVIYSITLFTGSFNIIRNYFTSIVKNEYVVKSEISRTIIGACIKVICLWLKAPLEYFILATMFDTVLVASGYYISYKKIVGNITDWKLDKSSISFYIKESFPLVLSGAAIVIYQRIDQVMLGNMIDNESVGYFATAGKFLDLILFLPIILTQTVTPILIRYKEYNQEFYNTKRQQLVNIVVWGSIIFAILFSLSSYWLINITYGKQYLAAVPILQIMAFKTVGMALSSTSGQIIIIEGIQKWAFIRNLMGCLTCVILNLILIPKYGAIGSSWVTIITMIVSGLIGNVFIPSYQFVALIQFKALLFGYKDLINIKRIFR